MCFVALAQPHSSLHILEPPLDRTRPALLSNPYTVKQKKLITRLAFFCDPAGTPFRIKKARLKHRIRRFLKMGHHLGHHKI
jgi:hypothetical protein